MKETTKAKIREGKVVSAYSKQITWICVDGNECQHTLVEDAKISINGKPGKLNDLKVGMPVSVTVCDDDDTKTSCVSAETIKLVPYT